MRICFTGDVDPLLPGIVELLPELGCSMDDGGIRVRVERAPGDLVVAYEEGAAFIRFDQRHHFFRGLGILVERIRGGREGRTVETPQFDTVGPMFDVSRNAVLTVDTCRALFRKLALMGLNAAMLYMEDVYEIPSQPYFGYLRGRYTAQELREIDDYGWQFGIEVIPSIQTLAHLDEFLKWQAAKPYRDTRGVLLTDAPVTYELIEQMISTIAGTFRSRRIHIGMDESEDLGRGRHLDRFGFEPRFDIFSRHLHRVLEMVRQHRLQPMMWSDMLLKLASQSGEDYYAGADRLPQHIVEQTPKDVQMVYWDYYHLEEDHYRRLIQIHQQFGTTPAFAGGIWVWNTFGANYAFSMAASESALRACKQTGVRDVYITLWGDDGNESNVWYSLAGLVAIAEHAYASAPDRDVIRARVQFLTGLAWEDYFRLTRLDEVPGTLPGNPHWDNPSKFLLWQDLLLGLLDGHVAGLPLKAHYESLAVAFRTARQTSPEPDTGWVFEVPQRLSEVLAVKAELGNEIRRAYRSVQGGPGSAEDARDANTAKAALDRIASMVLPDLEERVRRLRDAHQRQWMRTYKPFGWEVIDIRYGGLLARIDSAKQRLTQFIAGEVAHLEELEADRLPFAGEPHTSGGVGRVGYYYRAATPNAFFHVLPTAGW
ncbi:MAG: beta-N-acetylhexosaminidase [Alicyclobacillus sp.]|nr:beta-N-acetylhexosaminidase [Alicyclobacillus sp.]